MKKQFIAKLLVLAMVLAMVPGTLLTANAAGDTDQYYYVPADTSVDTTVSAPSADADDVKTTEGSATIKVKVTNGLAAVQLTTKAVEGLASAAKDGEITLVIEDEGATKLSLFFPAKAMTKLAEDTGADLTIQSSVATITIPNEILASALGSSGTARVTAEHTNNNVGFSVKVSGKSLKSVKGIKVEF